MFMSISVETKLDYDRTVNTEDRFAIRKAIDKFVNAVNKCETEMYQNMISDGAIIEGFSDIPQVKQGFITMLSRKFITPGIYFMRFPTLKLSYNRFMYHLEGTFEEFSEGILATEGTIEIALIKNESGFQIIKIVFYPRMMLRDNEYV